MALEKETVYWVKATNLSQSLREAYTIRCDCGGGMDKTDCTEKEAKEYGCGQGRNCCSAAFVCGSCGKRVAIRLPAPEMEDTE